MDIVARRTLSSELERQATHAPDTVVLIFESVLGSHQQFTYREFDKRVNQTAQALKTLGVQKGDRVHIHLVNCPEFLLTWFAAARIGAVMVPSSPQAHPEELAYLIEHSESRVSVTEPMLYDTVAAVRSQCPALVHVVLARTAETPTETLAFDTLVEAASADSPCVPLDPSDEAAML
ncbi:MAG: AMP-binding protein [candidate division Zixibacteria bacterium]|nr:AMP-binding protein [candidate division Zixibacteria bacterium]